MIHDQRPEDVAAPAFPRVPVRHWVALTSGLVALIAVGVAVDALGEQLVPGIALTGVDAEATSFLIERREPWLTAVAITLSWFADLPVAAAIVAGLGIAVGLRHGRWQLLWVPALAGAGALAISVFVKLIAGRARPPVTTGIVDAHGWAFPSGHAIRAMAVYAAIGWLLAALARTRSTRLVALGVAALLVAGVGFARVYLGVHWLTDVLGGFALGAAWLAMVLAVTRPSRAATAPEQGTSTPGPPQGLPGGQGLPDGKGPPE